MLSIHSMAVSVSCSE
jgi:hypothetical protein